MKQLLKAGMFSMGLLGCAALGFAGPGSSDYNKGDKSYKKSYKKKKYCSCCGRKIKKDKSGFSTNSDFFKAFFSFPYPLFKLSVKGFYGKEVTYETIPNFSLLYNAEIEFIKRDKIKF